MSRISDLSLLIYLAVVNHKHLPKVMSKWNGFCDESVYTESKQVELVENTIAEISSIYHCPRMFYSYFEVKRHQRLMEGFRFQYTDLDVAKSPLHWIEVKTWDEEDINRLKELRKEYIDNIKEDDKKDD